MPIYPTEASWTPTTSPSPDALYKDGNITVYAIPVPPCPEKDTPSPSTNNALDTSDLHLKRKREDSPDIPAKRIALMPQDYESTSPKFSGDEPQELVGEAAQDWRRLMIDTMFPGSGQKNKGKQHAGNNQKSKKSKVQGKGRDSQVSPAQTASDSTQTITPQSDPKISGRPQSDTSSNVNGFP